MARSDETLSQMAAYATSSTTIVTPAGTSRAVVARASPSIFPMLGASMKLGRPLLEREEHADSRVVVLSGDAWRSYFGASTTIVGSTVTLEGVGHTVVGVLAADFDFPTHATEFWIPFVHEPAATGRERFVNVVARLRDNVSWRDAAVEADVIGHQVAAGALVRDRSQSQVPRYRVQRLQSQMTAPGR